MLTAILAIAVLACAFGWFVRWTTSEVMVLIFEERGYPKPTKEEIECCVRKIVGRVLKGEV